MNRLKLLCISTIAVILSSVRQVRDFLAPYVNSHEIVRACVLAAVLITLDVGGLNSALQRESNYFNQTVRTILTPDIFDFRDQPRPDPVIALTISEQDVRHLKNSRGWQGALSDFTGYKTILDDLTASRQYENRAASVFFDVVLFGTDGKPFEPARRRRAAPDPEVEAALKQQQDDCLGRVIANDNGPVAPPSADFPDSYCLLQSVRRTTEYATWARRQDCADPISRIDCIVAAKGTAVLLPDPRQINPGFVSDFSARMLESAVPVDIVVPDDAGKYPLLKVRYACGLYPDLLCRMQPQRLSEMLAMLGTRQYTISPAFAQWLADSSGEGVPAARIAASGIEPFVRSMVVDDDKQGGRTVIYYLPMRWSNALSPGHQAQDQMEKQGALSAGAQDETACARRPNLKLVDFVFHNIFQHLTRREELVADPVNCSNVTTLPIAGFFDSAAHQSFLAAADGNHVVVGSAMRTGGDWHRTPLNTMTPGMMLHANAYLTLFAADAGTIGPDHELNPFMEVFAMAAISLVCVLVSIGLRRWMMGLVPALFKPAVKWYDPIVLPLGRWSLNLIQTLLMVFLGVAICIGLILLDVNGINTLEIVLLLISLPAVVTIYTQPPHT